MVFALGKIEIEDVRSIEANSRSCNDLIADKISSKFAMIAAAVKTGGLPDYKLQDDKALDSITLYEKTRRGQRPIAILCNEGVSPLPPIIDEESRQSRLQDLHATLCSIEAKIAPPTPA